MNIRKIYIVLCGLLLIVQTMNAQQKMYVLSSNGGCSVIPASQVEYATFANDNLFAITNDGIEETTNNMICASCTVAFTTSSAIKTLGSSARICVCYSKENTVPTINDNCIILGDTIGSYTFTLASLISGTLYYYRVLVRWRGENFYSKVFNAQTLGTKPVDNSKTINGHKFVDLGLPSGLLWATCNIGAEAATDDGNYYAWGETATKDTYNRSTYKYGSSYDNMTKYNSTDGKTVLENSDDAAYVNWGSSCRMPTRTEFDELCNKENCTWTWTSKTTSSNKTIKGYEVTSKKNGNSIFLPASGCRNESILYEHGSEGYYWSSTLSSDNTGNAYGLYFTSGLFYSFGSSHDSSRYFGRPVRPVAEP